MDGVRLHSALPPSPYTIDISFIPHWRMLSRTYCDIGLSAAGINCLGPVWVSGLSLVPWPPWRMIPFMAERSPSPSRNYYNPSPRVSGFIAKTVCELLTHRDELSGLLAFHASTLGLFLSNPSSELVDRTRVRFFPVTGPSGRRHRLSRIDGQTRVLRASSASCWAE